MGTDRSDYALIPTTCERCRLGHYSMVDGTISNFPCTADSCDCWFCGPVVTPAQAQARQAVAERRDTLLTAIVERIMTQHWDMAACPCWVCEEGRAAGCGPRGKWQAHSSPEEQRGRVQVQTHIDFAAPAGGERRTDQ